MTLKNNRAPLQCYFKLCASFRSHRWFQTGDTVWKRPIWVKIDNFWSRVTLKFDTWPWKTIGHLYYATSSSMHHLVAIGEFKLELQCGNAQFLVKIDDFFSRVTLQFDVWPWKTIGHLFYATSRFVHHFVAIGDFKLELQSGNAQFGQIRWFLEPCDLEIWRMTLNKANLRDLIAATSLVILLKLDSNRRFSTRVTYKFDGWPKKIIGHLFYITSSFVHHLKPLCEFKLELLSGNAQFGSKSAIFCPVWPWNLMDDLKKQ